MTKTGDDTEGQRAHVAVSGQWLLPILFLTGAVVFGTYYGGFLRGRPVLWSDSYEYAQAARALAEGRGLVTDSATVLEFWALYHGTLPLPYFFHDVGNSLLQALTFRYLGSSDGVIPIAGGLCFAALGPATFLLGRRLFGARVGGFATVLVLTNAQLLAHSVTGLSELPTALGLTVLFGLLVASPRYGPVKAIVLGAVFGALVVLRSNTLVFLPWIGVFLWTDPGAEGSEGPRLLARSRLLSLFLAGFLVIWGPPTIRTQVGLGRPLFTVASLYTPLFHTSVFPGESKEVYSWPGLDVDPVAFFLAHPDQLASKASWQLRRLTTDLLTGGLSVEDDWVESVLLFLFVVSLMAPPPDETAAQTRARRLLLALVGSSLVAGLLVFIRWRHLYAFLPAVLVYDAELLMRIFGKAGARGRVSRVGAVARLGLTALLLAAMGSGRLVGDVHGEGADAARSSNDYYQALGEFLRQKTRQGAVVLVRCPSLSELRALAWYGRRQLVEDRPYTHAAVMARNGPGAVFLLVTSGPRGGEPIDDSVPGFVSVARWNSGSGDHAALFTAPRERLDDLWRDAPAGRPRPPFVESQTGPR